jgi:hypothetical protein
MKRLSIVSVPLALMLCGFAAGATAQTTPPAAAPPATPAPASSPANHAMPPHVDDRINQMHQRLHITAEQQPAWDAFAQAMRDNAAASAQAYKDRAAHLPTMTAVENLRSFAQMEQTRAQGLQSLASSFETLYGGLTDEQKHRADMMFRRQGERAAAHKAQHP